MEEQEEQLDQLATHISCCTLNPIEQEELMTEGEAAISS